jgi:hypothetical protein
MKKDRFELSQTGKLLISGTIEEIEHGITELKLLQPHKEKMRAQLEEKGEFTYGLGLYHITKIKHA